MSHVEAITKAVGAHGLWKHRIQQAIATGNSEFTPAGVSPDNLCEFGKWLHSLPPAQKNSADWQAVQALHAKFHQTASHVLDLALKGHKVDAEREVGPGSNFTKASTDLTMAMLKWKSAAAAAESRA